MRMFSVLYFLFAMKSSFAIEFSSSFVASFTEEGVRVTSIKARKKKASVVLDNRRIDELRLDIQTNKGDVIQSFNLQPGKKTSVMVEFSPHQKLYIVCMSSPCQKLPLVFGQGPYEIP